MTLPTEIVRCDHCGGSFLAGDLETLRRNGYHDPATRELPACRYCGYPPDGAPHTDPRSITLHPFAARED